MPKNQRRIDVLHDGRAFEAGAGAELLAVVDRSRLRLEAALVPDHVTLALRTRLRAPAAVAPSVGSKAEVAHARAGPHAHRGQREPGVGVAAALAEEALVL